jgi:hypothetical protein
VIIEADYYADGIWWVSSKEEREAPLPSHLTRERQPGQPLHLQPWPLSQGLRDDLKAWNRSWDDSDGFWESAEARRAWEEQGRELAIRGRNELGTDGWEVLYQLGGQVHRVRTRRPPGQPKHGGRTFLAARGPDAQDRAEEEARVLEWLRDTLQEPSKSPAQTAHRQPGFDR